MGLPDGGSNHGSGGATSSGTAEDYLPAPHDLASLRRAAAECHGCDLWRDATQTVFGEGPAPALLMLVGEQPGDQEDLAGAPFVGPAGRVLDSALEAAGIDRATVYVTNVVKHFKWRQQGKRRLHERPNPSEVRACRPWLEEELGAVQPRLVVLLGATAAQSVLGSAFRVTIDHGRVLESPLARQVLATLHPSAILRARTDVEKASQTGILIEDLRIAARFVATDRT